MKCLYRPCTATHEVSTAARSDPQLSGLGLDYAAVADLPVQTAQANVRHGADNGADGGARSALHARFEGVQRVHHEGGRAGSNATGQRRTEQQLPRLVLLSGGSCRWGASSQVPANMVSSHRVFGYTNAHSILLCVCLCQHKVVPAHHAIQVGVKWVAEKSTNTSMEVNTLVCICCTAQVELHKRTLSQWSSKCLTQCLAFPGLLNNLGDMYNLI